MMTTMRMERERLVVATSDNGWIVAGEIDASTAPALDDALRTLPTGNGTVVVDVSDVTFIDSSGLRVLISLASRADDTGRSVILKQPSPTVTRLLEITGLTQMFGLASDPADT